MIKRTLDVCIASVALVLLSPALLALGVAVRLTQGSPILFTQMRAGRGERPFRLAKLRTMRAQPPGAVLSDDQRITPFGAWLRSRSLDELPQLWHVITGAMSLVGPRPLPILYLPRYTVEEARRHEVRPGLTGWAQVNGRNAISWEEKLALDVWYVDNQSIGLDFKILWMTVAKVVQRDSVNAAADVTMAEFRPPHPYDPAD